MSADLLRQAATLLRERADAAPPGPWHAEWFGQEYVVLDPTGDSVIESTYVVSDNGIAGYRREDCGHVEDYIATMHPGVGHALADWLDVNAREWGDDETDWTDPLLAAPVAVARAVLGETS
jgi:hypothetical protein